VHHEAVIFFVSTPEKLCPVNSPISRKFRKETASTTINIRASAQNPGLTGDIGGTIATEQFYGVRAADVPGIASFSVPESLHKAGGKAECPAFNIRLCSGRLLINEFSDVIHGS
jgi:hypothetical protein